MNPCPGPGSMLPALFLYASPHLILHKILGSQHYNYCHTDEETEMYDK